MHTIEYYSTIKAFLIAHLVKNLPAMQETLVRFLGQEDLLEEGQATHSSILGLHMWLSLQRLRLQCRRPWFDSWIVRIPWRRDRLPTPVFLGFPCGSAGKESACTAGDLGLIPGLWRSPGERKAYPLQHSSLENSTDFIVHRITESWALLNDSHSHFHF